jgi:signal transduction histidine kinase
MEETSLEELKRCVGWSEEEERTLRALHGEAAPHLPRIAKALSATILSHKGAKQSLTGGEDPIEDLEGRLERWLDQLLQGPWDEAYHQSRCRVGRWFLHSGLPQHRLFCAMNPVRRELVSFAAETYPSQPKRLAAACLALGHVLDLEFAIVLRTYREDLERLSTVGQLVGAVGHDLRNPLGVIETSVFLLRNRMGEDERTKKHLERIGEQVGVANSIIIDLLDIIRNKPLVKERVKLDAIVEGAAGDIALPQAVFLTSDGVAGLEVDGSPVQLRRVFDNLLTNAVQAASPSGEVRVHGSRVDDEVVIAVEDSGRGVDEATARRLFEPLTTTKDSGVGLGLALVKRIVARHGGTVAYERCAGGGARFVVRFPAGQRSPQEDSGQLVSPP